jgi:hypothetical protein
MNFLCSLKIHLEGKFLNQFQVAERILHDCIMNQAGCRLSSRPKLFVNVRLVHHSVLLLSASLMDLQRCGNLSMCLGWDHLMNIKAQLGVHLREIMKVSLEVFLFFFFSSCNLLRIVSSTPTNGSVCLPPHTLATFAALFLLHRAINR